jgi:Rhodanese-like domain
VFVSKQTIGLSGLSAAGLHKVRGADAFDFAVPGYRQSRKSARNSLRRRVASNGEIFMRSTKVQLLIAVLALISVSFTAIPLSASVLPPQSGDGVRRIKPEEVRDLLKQGKAILVDVRGAASYKAGHIKGALSIPYAEILDRAKELPRDKMIITYCS